jgi:hypothetical protein
MLKQIGGLATAAIMVGALITRVTAQEPLGFTIDPTQGLPGTVVSGQVDPEDIAAQCVTTVEGVQAEFQAVLEGPFGGGGTDAELFMRFFPGGEFIFENCEQAAYSITGITALGIGANFNGAAEIALPQTFVMTFVDLLTQEPLGELGHFDPVTGEGSVVVPDLQCGPQPIAAVCVEPTLDIDLLEAGIRENAEFLRSLGFTDESCDINSPEFAAKVEEIIGMADLFAFLEFIGPTIVQNIVVPDAMGLQFFNILCVPQTKDECKNGGWQQFNQPPPGLGFKNQGQCVAFFETGMFVGTTGAMAQ